MEGSNRGATVTPIRPEVQIADTTPFGASPPEPTVPTAVDDGTWGFSPRRRMCIQEPAEPTAADAEPPTNTDTVTRAPGQPNTPRPTPAPARSSTRATPTPTEPRFAPEVCGEAPLQSRCSPPCWVPRSPR